MPMTNWPTTLGSLPSLPLQRAEQLGPAKQGAKQMSPHVGNFVQDLVEMAKAMEALPIVQRQLEQAHDDIDTYAKSLQDRELAIVNYKQEIEQLHSKVRDLEVARDDAELRFLELDEAAGKAVHSLADIMDIAHNLKVSLDTAGVKQPEPTPVVIEDRASVQVDPIGHQTSSSMVPEQVASGQSEADPTVHGTTEQEPLNVQTPDVVGIEPASADPSPGPYFGKRYHDVPGYILLQDWLDGGGTVEDYHAPRSATSW